VCGELRQQRVTVKAQLRVAEKAKHALDALGAHVGAPLVHHMAGHGGPARRGRHVGVGLGLAGPLGAVYHLVGVVRRMAKIRYEKGREREREKWELLRVGYFYWFKLWYEKRA